MINENNRTLMIVDDDVDFLEQMEIQLQAVGYNVVKAGGQMEAEELLKDTKPDMAIIDLMMEHSDGGFALCYHIKKLYPDVPVVIVTAVASETGINFDAATEEEKSWIKADALLTKPIRFEQLRLECERLLEHSS